MSALTESWLQKAAGRRGVLACGVRLTDRSILVRTNREELSNVRIEQALKKLYDAAQLIQQNQLSTDRLRWSFESGQILFTARTGGVVAALFVNKDLASAKEMEKLLAEFAAV
ncbi:MAG TPA: hypothetical protein VIV82_04445 [Verrucomicrobiae bacterium]